MNEMAFSQHLEDLLVERDLRGMRSLQGQLEPGYCQRAAKHLSGVSGNVLIGTGFPVDDTFETDGPVGALILYRALAHLGAKPIIVCGDKLAKALRPNYAVHEIQVGQPHLGKEEAEQALKIFKPDAIIAIESPGLAANHQYHNMRGEDISARATCFDYFVTEAQCPTIAIGDGGNEIGMGKLASTLDKLNIIPSITSCDELIVADVSNWGVYPILAFLSLWHKQDLLSMTCPESILAFLAKHGCVDGVTRKNTLTEDGLPASEGKQLIQTIRTLLDYK